MRFFILLPCFVFTFLTFLSSVSYGISFDYDIDKFTVTSGTSTFVDDFDDGIVPPSGPSGSSTYGALGSFSSNAESLGLLNLNSNDASPGPEPVIGASLADSTYFINSGSGGSVEGLFSFANGFETNTGFIITIHDTPLSELESTSIWIQKESTGRITASFDYWTADPGTDISQIDITDDLGSSTDILLRLEVSTADIVTAFFDIGNDGSFTEMPGSGSFSLTFPGGREHTAAFLAYADPIPEPATVALLGIGLAGLAGAEVRRRRKKKAVYKS